jgi:hypothetical protein
MKKFKNILIVVFIIVVVIFVLRFFYGGDEDTWICKNGEWVAQGNPSSPKPVESCGDIELLK